MRYAGILQTSCLVLCSLCLSGTALAQFPAFTPENIGEKRAAFSAQSQYEEGIDYLRNWWHAQPNPTTRQDSSAWYAVQVALAHTFFDMRSLDSAEAVLLPVLDISPANFPDQATQILNAWGVRLVYGGRYLEAKEHFVRYAAMLEDGTLPSSALQRANAILNLGVVYNQLGEYDAALEVFHHIEDIIAQNRIENDGLTQKLEYNLASTYTSLSRYEESVIHARKAYALCLKQYGYYHSSTAQSLNSIANHLTLSGRLEEALAAYQEALGIYAHLGRMDHLMCSVVQLNIAETLDKLDCADEAMPYITDCIATRMKTFGIRHAYVARAFKARGTIQNHLGQFDAAYASMDSALVALGYQRDSENPYAGVDAMFNLFYTLDHRADIFYERALDKPTNENLEAAREAYAEGIHVLNDLRTHFKGKLSKENLNSKSYGFYEPAIDICIRMYERDADPLVLQNAFLWADESKDNDFFDQLRSHMALVGSGVPDSVLERQEAILTELTGAESKWFEASLNAVDDSLVAARNRLDKVRQEYRNWLTGLETSYPSYYQLLYAHPQIGLKDIQPVLQATRTQLVEYFIGDELALAFVLKGNSLEVVRLPHGDSINALVQRFRDHLTDSHAALLDSLAALVWEPVSAFIDLKADYVRIIPDGILHAVPFEILLAGTADQPLAKVSIAYSTSARSLLLPGTKSNKKWLGFAPSYGQEAPAFAMASRGLDSAAASVRNADWIHLPGAEKEVITIAEILHGTARTGEAATEENFRDMAPEYGILHLSMHAWTDDEEPLLSGLIFSDQKDADSTSDNRLYAHEIFGMHLPASLVVLSACNTGVGIFRRGEGMASLAEAFRHAGTEAVVMSLWKVPDESTAVIMESFYRHLRIGERKDDALRHAKEDYLNSVTEPELRAPYYWSGFVLTGNTSPIFPDRIPKPLIAVLGILAIGTGIYFVLRRRSSRLSIQ